MNVKSDFLFRLAFISHKSQLSLSYCFKSLGCFLSIEIDDFYGNSRFLHNRSQRTIRPFEQPTKALG